MQIILPTPGKYLIAVSGGVDSVALLDLLVRYPELELTVAHFDHGIRDDSSTDKLFVESLANQYKLPFVSARADLGKTASEATARTARYHFLRKIQAKTQSQAIITAHHQDDVLETSIINMLRGTGRRGLSSLQNQPDILRPLLKVPKQELINYAQAHKLDWREDSTNSDTKYLRNYVRHQLLPRFSGQDRNKLLTIIGDNEANNKVIDALLIKELQVKSSKGSLDRLWLNQLPHAVTREVLASWLRMNGISSFDKKTIERLSIAAKTAHSGQVFPILKGYNMNVGNKFLALKGSER